MFKALYYAGAAVACVTGIALCRSCIGTCCEPKDEWKIDDEIRPGELGAGYLYKRGKGAAVWSKRYFVLTEHKLNYYMDETRTVLKGSVILAGSSSKVSTTRANGAKKYYFTVSHPECGMREFYAKSTNRRDQWIEKLNDAASALFNKSHFGKLLKQGGFNKGQWQERWCICSGRNFEYFENPTDTNSKGSIDMLGAKVKEYSTKDQKYCFEVSALNDKKGGKKYVFAAEKEHFRTKWIEMIKKVSRDEGSSLAIGAQSDRDSSTDNPMVANSSKDSSEAMATMSVGSSFKSTAKSVKVAEKYGYLSKKSPRILIGWQKRFFHLKSSGEIIYYENEVEMRQNMKPKGNIEVEELFYDGSGVKVVNGIEIHLKLKSRTFELKAANTEDAKSWVDAINAAISAYHDSATV